MPLHQVCINKNASGTPGIVLQFALKNLATHYDSTISTELSKVMVRS